MLHDSFFLELLASYRVNSHLFCCLLDVSNMVFSMCDLKCSVSYEVNTISIISFTVEDRTSVDSLLLNSWDDSLELFISHMLEYSELL
jgi:hypothetical protein